MKKIYTLSSCDTCRRILRTLDPDAATEIQDMGTHPVNEAQLGELRRLSGSHEALLNKRARLYAQRGLKDRHLGEPGYRALLLEHYTFLKRPVIVAGGQIFIGNDAKTVAAAKEALHR